MINNGPPLQSPYNHMRSPILPQAGQNQLCGSLRITEEKSFSAPLLGTALGTPPRSRFGDPATQGVSRLGEGIGLEQQIAAMVPVGSPVSSNRSYPLASSEDEGMPSNIAMPSLSRAWSDKTISRGSAASVPSMSAWDHRWVEREHDRGIGDEVVLVYYAGGWVWVALYPDGKLRKVRVSNRERVREERWEGVRFVEMPADFKPTQALYRAAAGAAKQRLAAPWDQGALQLENPMGDPNYWPFDMFSPRQNADGSLKIVEDPSNILEVAATSVPTDDTLKGSMEAFQENLRVRNVDQVIEIDGQKALDSLLEPLLVPDAKQAPKPWETNLNQAKQELPREAWRKQSTAESVKQNGSQGFTVSSPVTSPSNQTWDFSRGLNVGFEDEGLVATKAHHPHGFCFVFVFPIPSVATEEDDKAFQKKAFLKGQSYKDNREFLEHILNSPSIRNAALIDQYENLGELRNVTIGMIQSFLITLGRSLESGLELFQFTSEDGSELFLCVKMGDHLAEKLACMSDYPFQLDPSALEKLHIKITDTKDICPTYIGYDTYLGRDGWLQKFPRPENTEYESILRPVDSMRLLYDKITDYVDLHELQRLGLLSHLYPAHDKDMLVSLQITWASFRYFFSPDQPIDDVRNYFGEGIAFYFLFLGFLTKGLLLLLVPAVITQAAWGLGYPDGAQAFFCLCLVAWSSGIVKFWKRTESHYANRWGTDRHDPCTIKDPINPRFHGEKRSSDLDENIMELRPDRLKQLFGYTVSVIVSVLFTILVIIGMEINQYWVSQQEHRGHESASTYGAILLSVQIQVWDKLWDFLIVGWLNDLEQHVTQYTSDQSRVAKTFVIKFINAFNAFLYMAYIQPTDDPEGCGGDCKDYLRQQLLIVMATYITFGAMDMALPYCTFKVAVWLEERKARREGHKVFKLSLLELQSKMCQYTGQDERADYLSIVFPVAFVMLFGTMMPAMVPLAYLALTSQIRTHAWKMVDALRRPFPVKTSGIGVWDPIMTFISYVGIFNSIGLLVAQVEGLGWMVPGFPTLAKNLQIDPDGLAAKALLFFIFQNIAALYKLLFDFLVSDVTVKTSLERERQEMQRVRISERGHAEFHEDIKLIGSKDVEKSGFHNVQKLEPGHPMHVDPLV